MAETSNRIATVLGARPQFIKAGPVSSALRGRGVVDERIVHTGQHYDFDMSGRFFAEGDLPIPWENLNVGSGSNATQIANMLMKLETTLQRLNPAMVLVYGDTNSTLAGVLAATALKIPVAHVEAGVRSHNLRMQEEVNRLVADRLSVLLFPPTSLAVENLRREGITSGVHHVGDVMFDVWRALSEGEPGAFEPHEAANQPYVVVTIHRAENTEDGNRLAEIMESLSILAREGYRVIFPTHPRTSKAIEQLQLGVDPGIDLVAPLSHNDMAALLRGARSLVTDSGGLQKEALWAEVPCVTVRPETEWPETVGSGWNILVEADAQTIACAALRSPPVATHTSHYGDGNAGARIAEAIERWVGAA